MGKTIRKKLFLDESRLWSFAIDKMKKKQLRDYLFGYFFYSNTIESYFRLNLINTSKDLTFCNRYTVTEQICLEQELCTYLLQHFITKMQTILF